MKMFKVLMLNLVAIVLSLQMVSISFANGPMPYTSEALAKLTAATEKVGDLVPPESNALEALIKSVTSHYNEIFSTAGYSFDKTVIKLASDMAYQNFEHNQVTAIIYNISLQVAQVVRKGKDNNISPKKFYNESTLTALNKYVEYDNKNKQATEDRRKKEKHKRIAEERIKVEVEEKDKLKKIEDEKERKLIEFEAKKLKLASEEKIKAAEDKALSESQARDDELATLSKQSKLNAIVGHYENKNSMSALSDGSMDIKVISNDKLVMSLYNKSDYAKCNISNVEAKIVIDYNNKIEAFVNDENETTYNDKACSISLR